MYNKEDNKNNEQIWSIKSQFYNEYLCIITIIIKYSLIMETNAKKLFSYNVNQ